MDDYKTLHNYIAHQNPTANLYWADPIIIPQHYIVLVEAVKQRIWKTLYFTFIPLFRLPKIAYDYRHDKWIYLNCANTWSFLI